MIQIPRRSIDLDFGGRLRSEGRSVDSIALVAMTSMRARVTKWHAARHAPLGLDPAADASIAKRGLCVRGESRLPGLLEMGDGVKRDQVVTARVGRELGERGIADTQV